MSINSNSTFNCRSLTIDPVAIVGTTSTISVSGNTNAFMIIHGSAYFNSRVRFSTTNYLVFKPTVANASFYQDPLVGSLYGFSLQATSATNGIQLDSNFQQGNREFNLVQGTFNVNGNSASVGWVAAPNSSALGTPTIDINGGTFQTTHTNVAITAFNCPYGNVRTLNGSVVINPLNRTVATIDTGSITPPAVGRRCSFSWNVGFNSQIPGTIYADSFNVNSNILTPFSSSTFRVKSLTTSMQTVSLATNTAIFDVSGGTLTHNGGALFNIDINHNGTTTTTNNIASDSVPTPSLTLTSGRLALANSTTFFVTNINASNTNTRGLDFGSGSILGGGPTGTYDFQTATNFTSSGTFNLQGGTGAKAVAFGNLASTTSTNWPNYTFRSNGDTVAGDFKDINTASFTPGSMGARTIRLKSINAATSANWQLVTLRFSGTGPYSITGTNQYYDLQAETLPGTITFQASSTTTLTDFTLAGTAGNLVTINSSVNGTRFNLSKASGSVTGNYLSIKDSNATGGATWTATNSANAGNNLGWIFPSLYTINGQFLQFFS
jgi:hypothetical protein